ncbi:hemin uptake protein HemP [Hydrogenophaga sp.]|uniref:hemin uptake protein HemP n=1 Tax=Hydrogenophaga sp. TaxID=1904254 RepID=UPI002616F416|nr:hemin uptake protein HemP [Hydrogenophaga sp.]MDM7949624.1 hemin uptake protein HemP [Hydrogenophaga sp.]
MSVVHPPPEGISQDHAAPDSATGGKPPQTCTSAAIRSETLLRGQPYVAIHHQGAVYRLQATRQGKLILTK